jgi:hypothetical protein
MRKLHIFGNTPERRLCDVSGFRLAGEDYSWADLFCRIRALFRVLLPGVETGANLEFPGLNS